MLKQAFLGLTIGAFLISCNSHPAGNGGKDSLPVDTAQSKSAYNTETLSISPALLKKYQDACRQDTVSYDKKFIAAFFEIIKRFNGRKLDTTLLTIGNLDGDSVPDSIFTRVYYEADTIYADSKWVKDDHVLWHDSYTDPYSEVNADLFDSSSRNTWVSFAIGIVYGPPNFHSRNDVDSSVNSIVYDEGLEDLKGMGIHLDKAQYKAYLRDFKGDLLAFGQPESREGLDIWYKPAGRMITYYHP